MYPPRWRERYGAVLVDLVAETGLALPVVLDLIRGALVERRRSITAANDGGVVMAIGPAWRHPNSWAIAGLLLMAPTLAFVVGSVFVYQLGLSGLGPTMNAVTEWLARQPRIVDLLLVLAPGAALLAAVAPLLRLELRESLTGREAVVAVRLRLLNIVVGAVAIGVGGLLVWYIVGESVLQVGA